jgi:alcohol dehydrogenase class IV
MLQMLPRLFQPGELVIKRGSLIRLQYLEGKRASIITGSQSLKQSGNLGKIQTFLSKAKIETAIIEGISGDPTTEMVQNTAGKLAAQQPDWIIAVGGGAVMDCAKLARTLYENPGLHIRDIVRPFSAPEDTRVNMALIPTTGGSGSEVSQVAVVKDSETRQKIPIVSNGFLPELVILDPALTVNLPPAVTAYTGLDALTHAVEAYCSKTANPLTNAYAVMAGKLIVQNLHLALAESPDINARENLQYAAMLAGISQNLASVGAVHALAHAVGAQTGLSHGHANAIFLAPVVKLNAESSPRPNQWSAEIGFGNLEEFLDWKDRVMESAGLSQSWQDAAAAVNHAPVKAEDIAGAALKDVCLRTNPVKIEKHDIIKIIEQTR